MPGYRLKQIVPWRDVLHVLRWHLNIRMRQYEQACRPSREGFINRGFVEAARQDVNASYQNYHALRSFLGYQTQTNVEREALKLLSDAPAHPPEIG